MRKANAPLYLPVGSVRSILAVMLVITSCAGFLLSMIGPDQFIALATMALAFYFSDRTSAAS